MSWDVKWIGGLLILLGFYLLLNCMILSEAPMRIIYHDLVVAAILWVCGIVYARGKGGSIIPWFIFVLGCYLQIASVLLWAPNAVQTLNHSVVGFIAGAVGALMPFAHADALRSAPTRPTGWSYNPSAWSQRLLVFVFCACCFAASSYMAAYQLGYIHHMWDPAFSDGTLKVITSALSQSFPVSDAGLGSGLYAIEALCVWKGGMNRWYTMPGFVLFFGILVIPVGIVSILLIISQPLIVGHWCFWCLLTAACMLCMIALAIDEVYAAIQFLMQTRQKAPHDFWRTFWHGGKPYEERGEKKEVLDENATWRGLLRGISPTLPLTLSVLIGAWLLVSATLQGTEDAVAHIEDSIGPLIITVAVIAMAEVARPIRYINLLFGVILVVVPLFIDDLRYKHPEAFLAGILLIGLSIPRGTRREQYGT